MNTIKNIDTKTEEGKMLMASLAKITTESQTDKTPQGSVRKLKMIQAVFVRESEIMPEDINF